MPLFDFVCTDCGTCFEELQNSDEQLPKCPECGSQKTEKCISLTSPVKKRGFPFKPGPVHPLAKKLMSNNGHSACTSCSSSQANSKN